MTRSVLSGSKSRRHSLHPAAASVVWDAMNEATGFTQVLGTTHSVELLDRKNVGADSLLVVEMVDGESRIGPVDRAGQSIMRDRLATAGELLRQNQLAVEPNGAKTGDARAADLEAKDSDAREPGIHRGRRRRKAHRAKLLARIVENLAPQVQLRFPAVPRRTKQVGETWRDRAGD